ncbi:hypothetical protein SBA4_20038 [Candidatus Sulfopaludibacter sp. SbA4]|nr:hypothetical protein SBA4_20038 [Candidatus Sulfopaludibacter sp. SbA4]
MQVNVHEAKARLNPALPTAGTGREGETVVIARHGQPVAELVPARQTTGFPFGIARQAPPVPVGNDWSRPMTDGEAEDWMEGRSGSNRHPHARLGAIEAGKNSVRRRGKLSPLLHSPRGSPTSGNWS